MVSFRQSLSYQFRTLEDFMTTTRLDINEIADDGWGAPIPIKAVEIQAVILFADISSFSKRTAGLSPIETLYFVNHFFAWTTSEAIRGTPCIIDKYIGDEIMLLFSERFGSSNPVDEALKTAQAFGNRDPWGFDPHIGIAAGQVAVGYVGTPLKFSCSVFGRPVAIAKRCAAVDGPNGAPCRIVFPASLAEPGIVDSAFGVGDKQPSKWQINPPRAVPVKNMDNLNVIVAERCTVNFPEPTAEDRAREFIRSLRS